MQLVHVFEMSDSKVSGELDFDMGRVVFRASLSGRRVEPTGSTPLRVYGLMMSDDCSSSFFAFSCDMKKAKLFCIRPVRNEISSGPGSPSPT